MHFQTQPRLLPDVPQRVQNHPAGQAEQEAVMLRCGNLEMPIVRFDEGENLIQMSGPKAFHIGENNAHRGFQQTQEYRLLQVSSV
jgi:hypothetical protein